MEGLPNIPYLLQTQGAYLLEPSFVSHIVRGSNLGPGKFPFCAGILLLENHSSECTVLLMKDTHSTHCYQHRLLSACHSLTELIGYQPVSVNQPDMSEGFMLSNYCTIQPNFLSQLHFASALFSSLLHMHTHTHTLSHIRLFPVWACPPPEFEAGPFRPCHVEHLAGAFCVTKRTPR